MDKISYCNTIGDLVMEFGEHIDMAKGKRVTTNNLLRTFSEHSTKSLGTNRIALSVENYRKLLGMGIIDHNRFEPIYLFKP